MSNGELRAVAAEIIRLSGGAEMVAPKFGGLLRTAFDEVIDGPRTGRWRLEDLEKTEKTYIGTKVENFVRHMLGLRRGRLDLLVAGHDVDVKFTLERTWMIPREARGHICLVIRGADARGIFSVGLLRMMPEVLCAGLNQDKKSSVSAQGISQVHWLACNALLPANMLAALPQEQVLRIMSFRFGTQRINELFRSCTGQCISRHTIEVVAQQDDALKRVRRNGGARSALWPEGIAILSGDYDRELIALAGLPALGSGQFISLRIADLPVERQVSFAQSYQTAL